MAPKKNEVNGSNGMKTISSFFKAKPNTSSDSHRGATSSNPTTSTSTTTSTSSTSSSSSRPLPNHPSSSKSSAESAASSSANKKQKIDDEQELLSREQRSSQWKYQSDKLRNHPQRSEAEQKRHHAFRKQLLGSESQVFSRGAVRDVTPENEIGQSASGSGSGSQWQDGIVIDDDDDQDDDNTENRNKLAKFKSSSSKGKGKQRATTATSTSSSSKSKGKGKANTDNGIKHTPLEKQILDLKSKYPGILLIIEVGYKFKFYGEDARIASQALNIMCFPERNLLSAMIPVHRINVHVKKLVSLGHKVGIVRQQETAALKAASSSASTPFIRELSNLYTSSTYIDEDDLALGLDEDFGNPAAANSMIAIVEKLAGGSGEDEFVTLGLVSVTLGTGGIVYDEWNDGLMRSELETRLAHLQPSELILPTNLTKPTEKLLRYIAGYNGSQDNKNQSLANGGSKSSQSRIRIERIESVPSYSEAFSRVTKYYESEEGKDSYHPQNDEDEKMLDSGELLTKVIGLPNLSLQAMSILINHLKLFKLSSIFKSTSNFQSFSQRSTMLLSSNTLSNLEIYKNSDDGKEKGSLVSLMDKCKTIMGKRLLRKWIGKPLTDLKLLEERRKAIEKVKSGKGIVNMLPELLKGLPDLEKGLARISYGRINPSELVTVLLSLNRLTTIPEFTEYEKDLTSNQEDDLIKDCLSSFPKARKVAVGFYRDINVQMSRDNKKEDMFNDPDKYPRVQDVKEQIAVVEHELNDHLLELRGLLKRPNLKYLEKSGIGFLVEVRVADSKKVPSDWLRISATKDFVRFHTPTIIKLTKERARYTETLAIEANKAFLSFLQEISSQYVILRSVISSIAKLDVILSLSKVATFPGYVKPTFNEEGIISIKGMRHPVVELTRLEPYVPNDLELGGENGQGLLISGSNMGGKSSTIKTIALIVLMAQIGAYVPADSANLKLHDSILTRMGAQDDLFKGRSTFMVEMQETHEIIKSCTDRSLVLMDELGRGTSTFDGQAIAFSVLDHFLNNPNLKKRPTLLFITHYLSLGEVAQNSNGRLRSMHMGYLENQDGEGDEKSIEFLYKLTPGLAKSSFGIHCGKLAGLPKELLQVASIKAEEMEALTRERERKRWSKRSEEVLKVLKNGMENGIDEGSLRELKKLVGIQVEENDDDDVEGEGEGQGEKLVELDQDLEMT